LWALPQVNCTMICQRVPISELDHKPFDRLAERVRALHRVCSDHPGVAAHVVVGQMAPGNCVRDRAGRKQRCVCFHLHAYLLTVPSSPAVMTQVFRRQWQVDHIGTEPGIAWAEYITRGFVES